MTTKANLPVSVFLILRAILQQCCDSANKAALNRRIGKVRRDAGAPETLLVESSCTGRRSSRSAYRLEDGWAQTRVSLSTGQTWKSNTCPTGAKSHVSGTQFACNRSRNPDYENLAYYKIIWTLAYSTIPEMEDILWEEVSDGLVELWSRSLHVLYGVITSPSSGFWNKESSLWLTCLRFVQYTSQTDLFPCEWKMATVSQ